MENGSSLGAVYVNATVVDENDNSDTDEVCVNIFHITPEDASLILILLIIIGTILKSK